MKTVFRALVALVVLAGPLVGQEKAAAFPASAQMDQYPIIVDTAGHAGKMIEMGLRLDTLKVDWTGLNWYEKWHGYTLKRFVYETLSTGTVVWSDSTGVPRYKADCVNRLASPDECQGCPVADEDLIGAINALADSVGRRMGDIQHSINRLEATLHASTRSGQLDVSEELRIIREEITKVTKDNRPGWFSRHGDEIVIGVLVVGAGVGAYCAIQGCLHVRNEINYEAQSAILPSRRLGGFTLFRFGG